MLHELLLVVVGDIRTKFAHTPLRCVVYDYWTYNLIIYSLLLA